MAPRRPAGLGKRGAAFWREVASKYQLRSDEARMLEDACREIDIIERLESDLADSPLMVKGSMGQLVASPLVQECRQHRNTLRALLKDLRLPEGEADGRPAAGDVVTSNARAAAYARWGRRGA